jgi:hypothetical protein
VQGCVRFILEYTELIHLEVLREHPQEGGVTIDCILEALEVSVTVLVTLMVYPPPLVIRTKRQGRSSREARHVTSLRILDLQVSP